MRTLGIDPDSKSITIFIVENNDLYRGGPEGIAQVRLEAKGRRAEDRFLGLVAQMRDHLPLLLSGGEYAKAKTYVYVERPFVGPNRKGAMDVGMVVGALRAEIARSGVPHSLVDPAVWKTRTLGTSRVGKDEIRQWAMVRFGLGSGLVQDYYDAACIAAYGMQVLGGKV